MLRIIFFTLLSVTLASGSIAYDKNSSSQSAGLIASNDTSRKYRQEFITILKELDPSLTGRTAQGNNYNLYAIKRGKEWTYMILDSTGYYSIKQEKSKDVMIENPPTYTEMLCLMLKAQMLRKVNKPKNISGLTLTNYYKFKPRAKKMYRSFSYIQHKVKFFQKTIQSPGGLGKILKRSIK